MSSDTYFDMFEPDAWDSYQRVQTLGIGEPEWDAWWAEIKSAREKGKPLMRTQRIGYLYNFVMDPNYDRWETFYDLALGKIDEEKVTQVTSLYREMYETADADPKNGHRYDMLHPDVIEAVLRANFGWVLYLRVD